MSAVWITPRVGWIPSWAIFVISQACRDTYEPLRLGNLEPIHNPVEPIVVVVQHLQSPGERAGQERRSELLKGFCNLPISQDRCSILQICLQSNSNI
ncbi:hypothetical protein BDM02DRAFT_2349660 [Thelephora ganbajun]|uniref:Uncharacterized protein n=1 Tax=Thelephora ganbajun TaxID=370292 RepID=A0ACB6ZEN9_THEGA|nr:hypothetical protein BDM02DRAFT_2349660 [Thelephora ganbajun]